MNVNVAVCTYQNEKFLDRCLTDIEQTVPIKWADYCKPLLN